MPVIQTNDMTAVPLGLRTKEIDRCSGISAVAFQARYLSGDGCPVIITDATDSWAARQKWTFSFFADRFGDQSVIVTDRLGQAKAARRVKFSEYLKYCQFPAFSSLTQYEAEFPFYLTSFSPLAQHPDLLDDFCQPYFVKNIYSDLTGDLYNWYLDGFSWIFIGPTGTLSPFHIDLFGTHAWLAQLEGTKDFVLVPPGNGTGTDSVGVGKRTPVKCTLSAGEVIFIPAGWAHQVVSLEPSISVTFNFVNESNYLRHILAISKDLPAWVKKVGKSGFSQANKHDWLSRGFDAINGGAL